MRIFLHKKDLNKIINILWKAGEEELHSKVVDSYMKAYWLDMKLNKRKLAKKRFLKMKFSEIKPINYNSLLK